MLTTSVIPSSTRAAYISTVSLRAGLGEIVGQQRGQRIGGREQRDADLIGVAHQHRQGHGLAERAPERQHDTAENAARRGG